jgi:hypothetical protein
MSILNGTHLINMHLIQFRKLLELNGGLFLCYPDFNKPVLFHLYTDASNHQLGEVIMQDTKPIAFYSQKLYAAQKWYTTTEGDFFIGY